MDRGEKLWSSCPPGWSALLSTRHTRATQAFHGRVLPICLIFQCTSYTFIRCHVELVKAPPDGRLRS